MRLNNGFGIYLTSNCFTLFLCTGATASRDYFPAITEAHYRKLPVLAITGAREVDTYGHLNPQTINRLSHPQEATL